MWRLYPYKEGDIDPNVTKSGKPPFERIFRAMTGDSLKPTAAPIHFRLLFWWIILTKSQRKSFGIKSGNAHHAVRRRIEMTSDFKPTPSPATATPPARGIPLHKRIYYSGVVALVAGLIGAALIYVFSVEVPATDPATQMASRRAYERSIELFGGKAMIPMVRFNQWLGTLWHGERLAFTVGVLSIVVALACFWAAGRVLENMPGDQDEDRNV